MWYSFVILFPVCLILKPFSCQEPDGGHLLPSKCGYSKIKLWILNEPQEAQTVPSFCGRLHTFSEIRSWHGWTCWTLRCLFSQRYAVHVCFGAIGRLLVKGITRRFHRLRFSLLRSEVKAAGMHPIEMCASLQLPIPKPQNRRTNCVFGCTVGGLLSLPAAVQAEFQWQRCLSSITSVYILQVFYQI